MKRYKELVNIIVITIICILIYGNINYVYGSSLTPVSPEQGKISIPTPGQGKGELPEQPNKGTNDKGTTGSGEDKKSLEDPISNPEFYEPTEVIGNNTKFINIGNIIIGTMRIVGTVIAVVILMAIGLKYMMGTAAERAEYKKTMIPYLIGAVMLFTIPNVLVILYELVKGINM